ncbi:MAG: hypothetical protein RRZ63_02870 [Clostridium sp.]
MKKLLLLLACATLLSGCTKSNIVQPDSETKVANPDFSMQDNIEIDWEQVSTDAEETFKNKNDYPYSEDFHFMLQPNSKEIMLVWVVSDDLPANELNHYSEALVKGFNDVVATQDFSIAQSGKDSYGGLWKNYGLSYGIAPVSTQDDESTWYINGSYGAGVDFVLPDAEAALKNAETADGGSETTP